MPQVANDTFTDTDGTSLASHTSDSGHSWNVGSGSGTLSITSNAVPNVGARRWYYSGYTPSSADYDVTAVIAQTGSYSGGPALRMDTAARTYYFGHWENTEWRITKYLSGSETSLGNYSGDSPVGTTRTARISANGSTIKLFIGGVERISVTDTDISAAGRPGIETSDTTGTIDDWSVDAASGGGANNVLAWITA